MGAGGVRVGGTRKTDAKVELKKAINLAKEVDQVVICAGLNVSVHFILQDGVLLLVEQSDIRTSPILNPRVTTGHTWTFHSVPTN